MAKSSEQFLKPEPNLGDAIMGISLPHRSNRSSSTDSDDRREKHFQIEIYDLRPVKQDNGIVLDIPSSPRSISAAYFVPNRFKHGFKQITKDGIYHPTYLVPMTDYTVNLVTHAWKNKRIISEAARPAFDDILFREVMADENAKRYAAFMNNGEVPTDPWFTEYAAKLALKGLKANPYQQVAAYNCCKSRSFALFLPPGTGKTFIMVTKIDYLISKAKRPILTLILCPKNIRTNWQNEIRKFSVNTDNIKVIELQGNNPTERTIKLIGDMCDEDGINKHLVIIAGYEGYVQTEKLHKLEFDLLLVDESHNFTNLGTKRVKTMMENRSKFHHRVIATGTPFRDGTPFPAFPQLEIMGDGISGHTSIGEFKNFYGQFSTGYNGKAVLTSFQNIPLMQEKLAKYSFSITKEQALPHLPRKTFSIVECELTKEQVVIYNKIADELYAEIENYGPEPDSVTIQCILTQLLRLAQITSGYVITDSGAENRFDPNAKLELLVKYLKGSEDDDLPGILAPDRKFIVWNGFVPNVKHITARLNLENIHCVKYHGEMSREDKDNAVQEFNCNPDCKGFIGTAASGGVGLNLVGFDPYNPDKYNTNCTDVIYFSNTWSYPHRAQSLERAHRFITRVPVHIVDLIVPHTIETQIYDRLEYKKGIDTTIQDVRGILKRIATERPTA